MTHSSFTSGADDRSSNFVGETVIGLGPSRKRLNKVNCIQSANSWTGLLKPWLRPSLESMHFASLRRAHAAGGPDSDRYLGNSLIAWKKSSTLQAGSV